MLLRARLRRRTWIGLTAALLLAVYLVALSVVPALVNRDQAGERRRRGLAAMRAPNWALVLPDDRDALGRAVDQAWRDLSSYQMRYVSGPPEALAAGGFEAESTSAFRLGDGGRIMAQRDTNYIGATTPGSGGVEQRFEGFRVRTDQPYVNRRGQRVADAELIYQRNLPGLWTCERVAGDRALPEAPALDFTDAGDAGVSEIDGRPVRGFTLSAGAFGLRAAATVWIEIDTLRLRRQQIESAIQGRREIWTFGGFDAPLIIELPSGVTCTDG